MTAYSLILTSKIFCAGGICWNIVFPSTENRCNSGMYQLAKEIQAVIFMESGNY